MAKKNTSFTKTPVPSEQQNPAEEQLKPDAPQSSGGRGWDHPGGKLLELGPEKLTHDELLSIIIGSGIKGRSALEIAKEVMDEYVSFYGLLDVPMERLLKFKGLNQARIVKIAAALEIGRRLHKALA